MTTASNSDTYFAASDLFTACLHHRLPVCQPLRPLTVPTMSCRAKLPDVAVGVRSAQLLAVSTRPDWWMRGFVAKHNKLKRADVAAFVVAPGPYRSPFQAPQHVNRSPQQLFGERFARPVAALEYRRAHPKAKTYLLLG